MEIEFHLVISLNSWYESLLNSYSNIENTQTERKRTERRYSSMLLLLSFLMMILASSSINCLAISQNNPSFDNRNTLSREEVRQVYD
jgi:hypothetical protein